MLTEVKAGRNFSRDYGKFAKLYVGPWKLTGKFRTMSQI